MLVFDIELAAPCNAKCDFCPQSFKGVKRKKPYLDEKLLIKIMNEIKILSVDERDGVIVDFCGMGENLLRKDLLLKALEILFDNEHSSLDVRLTTNGYYLTEELVTNPLFQKLSQIEVSLAPTLDSKKYESIYKIDYNVVKNNVINLKKYFKNKLIIAAVKLPSLKNELEAFKSFWKKYVDGFLFHNYHSRGGHIKNDEAYSRNYFREFKSCSIFYLITFISSDGDVLPCCHDVKSENIITNLNDDSISSVIQKKRFMQREYSGFNICKNCTDSCMAGYDRKVPDLLIDNFLDTVY